MRAILMVLFLGFLSYGCAGMHGSSWAKEDWTPAQLQMDYTECQDNVRGQRKVSDGISWGMWIPLIGPLAAIGSVWIQADANKNVKDCMKKKGYVWQ